MEVVKSLDLILYLYIIYNHMVINKASKVNLIRIGGIAVYRYLWAP